MQRPFAYAPAWRPPAVAGRASAFSLGSALAYRVCSQVFEGPSATFFWHE